MINQTRITVDDATRQVLDELSGHLAQAPAWAGQLTDDIQEAIRDATRAALAAPIKSIGQIDAQLGAVQVRIASVTDTLTGLSGAMQALDARIDARIGAQASALDQHGRAVDGLVARSDDARAASAEQTRAIVALQQQAQATGDKTDALRSAADAHAQQLAALLDHARKLDAATDALLGTHAVLLDVQTAQAAQRDALQTVLKRVEYLSKPWWKRLFGAAGSAR
ncbi:hypothetical protein [Burkholderia sp. Ac-20353]|uniref:hypothetical protein n=1 Tax=Burkholderia sp. Ac-20353 TaxID=2703894 RepID=UPI00197B45C4|nr:hypothetical protein [Burkholderia sp. Ac-20353]MBN3787223.1 hypothetical protein [Burkholderia sp. Ac-20353]